MDIRQLVNKYQQYLKNDDYDGLFAACKDSNERKDLIEFLYNKCGIDVLPYMTSIPPKMFQNVEGISQIRIPDNITDIGERAFIGSLISKVVLPNTIKKLPMGLFENCFNLHKIFIPDSVTEFSQNIFKGTPDDILIGANFRSDNASKLRFPQSELDFYRQHLRFRRNP